MMTNRLDRNNLVKAVFVGIVIGVFALGSILGCAASRTQKGAAIGGAAGAAIGGIVGHQHDKTAQGAVIGAAAGAVVGGVIGHYMDKQAEELAKIEGAKTERVGDEIKVTWDSAILFDFDSAMLKTDSQDNMEKMADVFVKYPDTDIIIAGHTDSKGSEDYNQKLSERRATSVRQYLVDMGVPPSRLQPFGYGELRPAATNDDDAGRSLNRRVEIEIKANEELKARAAEEEKQG
jgi:outer membrane protein OmpA-like peptidoglycan-associated protein